MLKSFPRIFIRDLNTKALLLILIGSLTWSLVMIKSGIVYDFGMGFWGPNGHDGVWHIAMAEGFAGGTWELPMFAGETIKNYHIGFDLILVALHKLTFIPINILYFQIIPPILALGIGVSVYKFVLDWQKSKNRAFWATFFIYFGGGLGWVLSLIRNGKLGGESAFWSQQSISTLINPPFALSILFFFIALNMLQTGIINKDKKYFVIATFLFGVLVQIKVYAGLLALAGLFIASIYEIFRNRKIMLFKVFSGTMVLSLLLLLPILSSSTSTIVFRPFWFLETMLGFSDRAYWPKLAEAMVNYRLAGNWLKAVLAYTLAFVIFWYGNVGTRLIQELLAIKLLKKPKSIDAIYVFIAAVILIGAIVPMFFVQRGTPWNTIQFLYYSLVLSGVFAGIVVGDISEYLKSKLLFRIGILTLIILLTIPTTIGTLWYDYLPSRPPAMISNEELEALKFLSKQPRGVVLTLPFDKALADAAVDNPPRPLYLYESTAYVSAFSGQPTYLEDEVNLEITGYDDWRSRKNEIEQFRNTQPNINSRGFLDSKSIDYIYWLMHQNARLSEDELGINNIFENDTVQIYKVR